MYKFFLLHIYLKKYYLGIENAKLDEKIGILIGVGGGYAIDSRIGLLRILYKLGVRFMSLTPGCNTPW